MSKSDIEDLRNHLKKLILSTRDEKKIAVLVASLNELSWMEVREKRKSRLPLVRKLVETKKASPKKAKALPVKSKS